MIWLQALVVALLLFAAIFAVVGVEMAWREGRVGLAVIRLAMAISIMWCAIYQLMKGV